MKVFKENKQFTLFSILALIVVGVAVFAPQIAPYDPLDAVMLESLQAPSSAHPFGTDKLGRDLLSRVIFGTRTSLVMTLCLVAVIFEIGTFLGVIAGYFGGIVDGEAGLESDGLAVAPQNAHAGGVERHRQVWYLQSQSPVCWDRTL